MCELTRLSEQRIAELMYERIPHILRKIVALTVLYQVAALSMGVMRAYARYDGHEYGAVVVHATVAMERAVLLAVVVLMVEHNDELYQALLRCLRCGCCCGCAQSKRAPPLDCDVETADTTEVELELIFVIR